ncbi:TetR/AcrR family transcriptional regulator [Streptomyces sp. NPDC005474]|uniref:TetR/AcrR family transcriptional regulator n=1 Tax=Streptomyces sp. NPDC005474 TaxID=3154878 RepID=UPI0034512224
MTTPGARRRTPAPPREDVLAAAMGMVAERGLEKLTMAALGRAVGMSSGHLLYYFHSKDELLFQALEWSEGRLGAERGRLLTRTASARERLDAYVDLYVPDGHRDPHWTLWLEVWNRSQNADDAARDRQAAIEGAWHRDLVALLAEGVSRGEFRPVDPDRFGARLRALLDGFSIQVAIGLRGTDRAQVLRHVREFVDDSLLAAS